MHKFEQDGVIQKGAAGFVLETVWDWPNLRLRKGYVDKRPFVVDTFLREPKPKLSCESGWV